MIHYIDINRYRYKLCLMCFLDHAHNFKGCGSESDALFNGKISWLKSQIFSGCKWENVVYNSTPNKLCDQCSYILEHTISGCINESIVNKVNRKIFELMDEHKVDVDKELIDV